MWFWVLRYTLFMIMLFIANELFIVHDKITMLIGTWSDYTGKTVLPQGWYGTLSAFRPRGVPGLTSKIVAACPSPDGLARDGTQGGKPRLVSSCARGDALAVGVTSVRERERERERERVSLFVSPSSRATTLPHEG
jgi:hypothetical protein